MSRNAGSYFLSLLILLLAGIATVHLTAQSSSGAIAGSVQDPLGNYTVTAVAPGFSTATETGVIVQINSTTSLDIKLKPGQVSESVTVDASGLRIETETSEIDGTVSNKQIEDLPLSLAAGIGGLWSPETFVFLLPGTTGPGSGTSGNTGNGVFFSKALWRPSLWCRGVARRSKHSTQRKWLLLR